MGNLSGYTKLFSTIIGSTIWREPDHVRLVWITMLATANQYGEVECSVPGLADFARVSREQCDHALRVLSSPDEDSRTKTDQGRRIEAIDGGWRILNHAKYRQKMSADDRREYKRLKMREYRARGNRVDTRRQKLPVSTQAEAEADTDTDTKHVHASREAFERFWACYPRKTGKRAAWLVWQRLKPSAETVSLIFRAIAEQAQSPQWQKDGGAFIPHPRTWLYQGRWEDEPAQVAASDPVAAARAAYARQKSSAEARKAARS